MYQSELKSGTFLGFPLAVIFLALPSVSDGIISSLYGDFFKATKVRKVISHVLRKLCVSS